jgi:hypothetical protein
MDLLAPMYLVTWTLFLLLPIIHFSLMLTFLHLLDFAKLVYGIPCLGCHAIHKQLFLFHGHLITSTKAASLPWIIVGLLPFDSNE